MKTTCLSGKRMERGRKGALEVEAAYVSRNFVTAG
jgi:hypothetical protein